jgi:hypothetical protein
MNVGASTRVAPRASAAQPPAKALVETLGGVGFREMALSILLVHCRQADIDSRRCSQKMHELVAGWGLKSGAVLGAVEGLTDNRSAVIGDYAKNRLGQVDSGISASTRSIARRSAAVAAVGSPP